MAEQTIYVNNERKLVVTDNNYTNTVLTALIGPQGKPGPIGPPGPQGPRGARGRAAPFYPRTVYASQNINLVSGSNVLDQTQTSWIRVSSSSTSSIDGINSGTDGELRILTNTGTNNILIKNNSTTATSDQRILISDNQNITLYSNSSVSLIYDQIVDKWRLLSNSVQGA